MKKDTNAIRNELCEFIRIANDKKINALYELLSSEMKAGEEWFKDENLVQEFETRYNAMESGEDEGVTPEALLKSIAERRKKKYGSSE